MSAYLVKGASSGHCIGNYSINRGVAEAKAPLADGRERGRERSNLANCALSATASCRTAAGCFTFVSASHHDGAIYANLREIQIQPGSASG